MVHKLTLHINTARGHGPNGTLPHEKLWCQCSAGELTAETAVKLFTAHQNMWDETIELGLRGADSVVEVRVLGSMPGHDHVDVVGAGKIQLAEVRFSCFAIQINSQKRYAMLSTLFTPS